MQQHQQMEEKFGCCLLGIVVDEENKGSRETCASLGLSTQFFTREGLPEDEDSDLESVAPGD